MCLKFLYLLAIFPMGNSLKNLIDLTWDLDDKTINWPTTRLFEFTNIIENDDRSYWYASMEMCLGEHIGTHIDAPYHFYKNGWKTHEIPLEKLFGNGAFVDLSHRNLRPNYELTVQDLEHWVQTNGPVPENCILLISFGHSKYYSNRKQYLGLNSTKHMNFPAISPEAAEWIVSSRRIVGVGLDTASIDSPNNLQNAVHRILTKAQIFAMENVKIPGQLPAKNFKLIALPAKIRNGSGGPVRVVAIVR